jgi:hypothetical protein
MVFNYYNRLSAAQKRIYRRSDEISAVPLKGAKSLQPIVGKLEAALAAGNRPGVETACRELARGITASLAAPPVRLQVLAVRPSDDWGELHGLYNPAEGRRQARIQLWMRTARHKRIVAFRSFLRTLLHELCHHLDYELYELDDSFHTEGFYKRESSLFHQLVPGK